MNMKIKTEKKLTLNKVTVTDLNENDMEAVHGGNDTLDMCGDPCPLTYSCPNG